MLSFLCKCCIIISTLLGVSLHLGDVSHFANKLSQFSTLISLAAGFFYLYWARASIRGEELENTRGFLCTRLSLLLGVLTAGIVYHAFLAPAAAPKKDAPKKNTPAARKAARQKAAASSEADAAGIPASPTAPPPGRK